MEPIWKERQKNSVEENLEIIDKNLILRKGRSRVTMGNWPLHGFGCFFLSDCCLCKVEPRQLSPFKKEYFLREENFQFLKKN